MTVARMFLSLLVIGSISFGGGYAVIPLLQYQLVTSLHLVSSAEFVDAIAVGQVTPGPVLVMAAFIGYGVAGLGGALLAMLALFGPSFVAVLALSSAYERVQNSPLARRAIAGVTAAVTGLLGAAIIDLVRGIGVSVPSAAIALAVFVLVLTTKIEPVLLVLGGGVLGYLLLR